MSDQEIFDKLTKLAQNEYQTTDIEIDELHDDSQISVGDSGTWVQGWVWVGEDDLRSNGLGEWFDANKQP